MQKVNFIGHRQLNGTTTGIIRCNFLPRIWQLPAEHIAVAAAARLSTHLHHTPLHAAACSCQRCHCCKCFHRCHNHCFHCCFLLIVAYHLNAYLQSSPIAATTNTSCPWSHLRHNHHVGCHFLEIVACHLAKFYNLPPPLPPPSLPLMAPPQP